MVASNVKNICQKQKSFYKCKNGFTNVKHILEKHRSSYNSRTTLLRQRIASKGKYALANVKDTLTNYKERSCTIKETKKINA